MLFTTLLLAAAAAPITFRAQAGQDASSGPSEHTLAPPPSAYAGAETCAECHRKEAEFYGLTPHARDSAPSSAENILGSFIQPHDLLRTANPNLVVAMEAKPDGFYQAGINIADPDHPTGEEERFGITVGSGRHGQTYLYWDDDELYELPVSYWTWNHEWVLSPGFPANQIHFNRPVVPRCLECHGSYFTWLNPPDNRFDKKTLVLGIDCERCHGPGAVHVARERSDKPPAAGAKDVAIVNPSRLTHQRQIDLCSLCHAGGVDPIAPPMTFQPGDNVRNYLDIPPLKPGAPVDVHGNQVGALEQSKCFSSGKMTCSTCHNVHRVQENADAFSAHCLTCHEVRACGKYKDLGAAIRTRCVECHMPVQDSAKILPTSGTRTLHALLRQHTIAIYPDAAAEVEGGVKAGKVAVH